MRDSSNLAMRVVALVITLQIALVKAYEKQCNDGMFLEASREECYENCNNDKGYYPNSVLNICARCYKTCNTCTDWGQSKCIKCNP